MLGFALALGRCHFLELRLRHGLVHVTRGPLEFACLAVAALRGQGGTGGLLLRLRFRGHVRTPFFADRSMNNRRAPVLFGPFWRVGQSAAVEQAGEPVVHVSHGRETVSGRRRVFGADTDRQAAVAVDPFEAAFIRRVIAKEDGQAIAEGRA